MLQSPRRARRATATVELAVVLALVLVPALIGIWELARLGEFQQIASNAAREGARRASSGHVFTAEAADVALDYLKQAGITTTNATVQIENVTTGSTVTYNGSGAASGGSDFDLKDTEQNDRLRVTVTVPYNDVKWGNLLPMFAGSSLVGKANWYSLRDKDFPSLGEPAIE